MQLQPLHLGALGTALGLGGVAFFVYASGATASGGVAFGDPAAAWASLSYALVGGSLPLAAAWEVLVWRPGQQPSP